MDPKTYWNVAEPVAVGGGKKEYVINKCKFVVDTKYDLRACVGTGSYGTVCPALDTETGERVAIKKMGQVFDNLIDGKRILRELKLLTFLKHGNVISITDILRPTDKQTFEDIYLVTRLYDTDLAKVFKSRQALTEAHVADLTYQLLCALKYIHSAGVLHRDIKPGNLLMDRNCDMVLCDFGLARGQDDEMTSYVVTRWYRAPELLCSSKTYSTAVDMWAFGCILGELHARRPLFCGKNYLHQLRLVIQVIGSPTEEEVEHVHGEIPFKMLDNERRRNFAQVFPNASADAVDLLEKVLVFDPRKRITAEEALKHPYYASLHLEDDEPLCPNRFIWDKDSSEMTEDELRHELWQEILKFHPDP